MKVSFQEIIAKQKASNIFRCFLFLVFCFYSFEVFSQINNVSGYIYDENKIPIYSVEVVDKKDAIILAKSNKEGYYSFQTDKKEIEVIFFAAQYDVITKKIVLDHSINIDISLPKISVKLNEVQIKQKRLEFFDTRKIEDVIETSIFAAKKTEAILINDKTTSLALNNARKIYSKVAGLNVFQNDDAGLQLNIGGRGLDPSRTSNFNTRQNGYDISADVLGYPESYYSPPAEAIQKIEIIRGAASLQYGTQFGGLINFVLKEGSNDKELELISRNTLGSNNLFTNFISLGGTVKKFNYITFYNRKKGSGFRDNSSFLSNNLYSKLTRDFGSNLSLSFEITYLNYLAQQAGGLTDYMFEQDPFQSNRSRNWFAVNWLLYSLQYSHMISEQTTQTINFFGLSASRDALGFRTNRVDQVDVGTERDLIKGKFNNYGFEYRILNNNKILQFKSVSLLGIKFYKAKNKSRQGPGSDEEKANFDFQNDVYPFYNNQSNYTYPNLNLSFFGENIIYFNDKISITPGYRFEHIDTQSDGYYKKINFDGASNPILDTTIYQNRINKRNFLLLGLGFSFKNNDSFELYANYSENYRSVTFADITIINPSYVINPNIKDEDGYTLDLGSRGNINNILYYDFTAFHLMYNNRIGFVQKLQEDNNIKMERGNVGDARIFGLESLLNFNFKNLIKNNYIFSCFLNVSYIHSKYTRSEVPSIKGKKVEFIPNLNLKSGVTFGYSNFQLNIQYSFLSSQFTDASNSTVSNLSGVVGAIPAYQILDLSLLYNIKTYKIELGINNILDSAYFTRRARGYPGPGIIPSPPRNYYLTLEIKI